MKTNSTLKSYKPLKRGNGFKKKFTPMKKTGFNRTPTNLQKEIRQTDSKFSKFIINRDKKCKRCGSTYMNTCSHFHPRAIWATRFDPDNCVDFCQPCHDIMESKKNGEYKEFMIALLGKQRFFILEHKSKLRVSKEESLILANNLLKKVEDNSDIQY